MGKADAAKEMASEENKKDIDSISALMEISQAGKLGQVESLVLQLSLMTKEMTTARDESVKATQGVASLARRMSEESTAELKRAYVTLSETITQAEGITSRMDALSRRPDWEPFALALVSAFVMAAFVAGTLYVTLPDYGQITKNQVAIYHAVETVKGGKTKGQVGK